MSKFSEKLRDMRHLYSLTQKDLGDKLGFAESTISLYEAGKREPDIATLIKICDYFNCTLDEMIGRSIDHPQVISSNQTCSPRSKIIEQIKKQIKSSADFFHQCQAEYKRYEAEADELKTRMNELNHIMNTTKTIVYKLEELIKDEVR